MPRAYLIIAEVTTSDSLAEKISLLGQKHDIACALLKGKSQDQLRQRIDIIRPLFNETGISILIEDHSELVKNLGVDGLHILSDENSIIRARETLGPEVSIGGDAGHSRHKAMLLGEAGADYVAFSGSEPEKIDDMCAWWAPLFELPCIAFYPETVHEINHNKHCDFYAVHITG